MLERNYQSRLIKKLRLMFEGCLILKNDSAYIQGIPDLIILHNDRWAALEVKTSARASTQPNQDYYVDLMNEMAYAAYIYPDNEEAILHELQSALTPRRKSRVPQR